MDIRPRRSMLYMPGSNARALEKARSLPADALILDLEDAVAPDAKDEARERVATALEKGGYGHREVIVRVNGLDTPWGREDVSRVAPLPAHGVLFPKVGSAEQVHAAVEALDKAGGDTKLPVWIMLETPRGVLQVESICGASRRLAGVVMGTSDLAKELHARHTSERIAFVTSLSLCVLAARANDLAILDGVHLNLNDTEGMRAVCRQGLDMGFDGKTLIHPKQIDIANEIFSPDAEAVQQARQLIEAWEQARARGQGVCLLNGRLVENLHVEQARHTLALHKATQR